MGYLVLVSTIWAFSFGLIKSYLPGIDPSFVSFVRMSLSWIVFIPLIRIRRLSIRTCLELSAIGALQFGLMYVAYIASFQYLAAYQVALFTIFTPIYIALMHDALKRTFHWRYLGAALCAILAAALVVRSGPERSIDLTGFALVQLSNLGFAAGQIWYGSLRVRRREVRDRDVFALLYSGAALVTLAAWLLGPSPSIPELTTVQWSVLGYLGVIASGFCFFLWNVGMQRVNAGTLAVMNNLKIPLAVLVSVCIFAEPASLTRLFSSLFLLLLALHLTMRHTPAPSPSPR